MNKKSRIKTTLDSLFTGGRIEQEPPKVTKEKKTSVLKPSTVVEKKVTIQKVKTPTEPKKVELNHEVNIDEVEKEPARVIPDEQTKPMVTEVIPQPQKPDDKEQTQSTLQSELDKPNLIEKPPEKEMKKNILADEDEHLVIFTLGQELYGVTIHSVESIIKIQAITEVPRTAAFVLGVTNLRGTVVPVLDLRKRFNLEFSETTPNTRIIIVNAEGSKVGIVVDEVTEVLKVPQNSIKPPPPMSTTIESAFISGIARINNRLVILLDLEKVLASSVRQYSR
jgi:purine-binding chemotaxis protein CheW